MKKPPKLKILVVDDDRELTAAFETLLEEEGFDVHCFHNGNIALENIKLQKFDALIVDGLLPGIDGFKLCNEVRSISTYAKLPIIMISGVYRAAKYAAETTKNMQLSEYLEKPIAPLKIIQSLKKIFGENYPGTETSDDERKKANYPVINKYFIFDPSQLLMIGTLDAVPFPLLMGQIFERKLTGQLMLERQKAKKIVSFDRGSAISISSNIISECLGQIMLRSGSISRRDLDTSLQIMKSTKQRQGDILKDLGVVDDHQITRALKQQFHEKMYTLFRWNEGTYNFKGRESLPNVAYRMAKHPYVVIREGISLAVSQTIAEAWLKPYFSSVMRTLENGDRRMTQAGYTLKEVRYFAGLQGNEKLGEQLSSQVKPKEEMAKFLLTLLCLPAIGIDQPLELSGEEHDLFDHQQNRSILGGFLKQHFQQEGGSASVVSPAEPVKAENSETKSQIFKQEKIRAMEVLSEEEGQYYLELYDIVERLRESDYFEALEVNIDTPIEEVKKTYVQLARKYHPDTIPFADKTEIKTLADEIFSTLSKAHDTLTNKKKRLEYIKFIEDGGDQDATEEVARLLAAEQHLMQGKSAARRRDWETALNSYRKSIELNPQQADVYAEMGWAHFNLNPRDMVSRQEALRLLGKALKLSRKHADAHFYIGSIYKAVGELDQATEWFRKTLAINKKHGRARSEIRLLKMRKSEAEERKNKKSLFSVFKK